MIAKDRPGLSLTALMLLLGAPIFFLPAFTPDEIWILNDAASFARQGASLWNLLPHLGYGAAFWYGYELLVRAFGDGALTLYFLRGIAFTLLASLPLLLWRTGRESPWRWHALILWWVLPLAWWNGKIDSPEIPACWLCVAALLLIENKRSIAGWLIFGLAIGLKLTCLPVAFLFIFAAFAANRWRGIFASLSAAAGFVAMNPVVLHRPGAFAAAIADAASPFGASVRNLFRLLVAPYWEWDGIPSGGIFVHGVVFPAAVLLTIAFALEVRRRSPAALVSAGVILMWLAAIALNLRTRFTIWYIFPLIALTPFVLLRLRTASRRLVTFAVASQILFGIPLIAYQYLSKVENYHELANYGTTRAPVRTVLSRWNPDTVADDSTVGRLRLESMPGVKYLPEMASQFLIFEGPRYWLKATPSRRVAMAVDKRLLGMNHRYNVRENAASPDWCGDWQLLDTAETPGALLYLFGLPETQAVADAGK